MSLCKLNLLSGSFVLALAASRISIVELASCLRLRF